MVLKERLTDKIYSSQQRLYEVMDGYSNLHSNQVLASSRNLDKLIIEFYNLTKDDKKKASLYV